MQRDAGKKIRPNPAFTNLCDATVAFILAGRLPDQFTDWMAVSTAVLMERKSADFIRFLEFSESFYGQNASIKHPVKNGPITLMILS